MGAYVHQKTLPECSLQLYWEQQDESQMHFVGCFVRENSNNEKETKAFTWSLRIAIPRAQIWHNQKTCPVCMEKAYGVGGNT